MSTRDPQAAPSAGSSFTTQRPGWPWYAIFIIANGMTAVFPSRRLASGGWSYSRRWPSTSPMALGREGGLVGEAEGRGQ
eukprot:11185589-Lingulodinium_polyedra.AAC.1